jgi:DHA3 family macrolide efflux protein-like MFS transporter
MAILETNEGPAMQDSWRKQFFKIYTGQAFSLLSSSAVQFAIIWWITVKTSSAIDLTIASIVGLLPQVLIGPIAGVWIDRHSRKTIMILADSAVAASSLVLGLSFLFGEPPLAFVYVILFLRALGETFHKPAMKAAIPQLVPAEALTKAGGFGQLIQSACAMVGPMLGALLMSVATMPLVMAVDVVGAALAVLTLATVRLDRPQRKEGERPGILAETKEAFGALRSDKALMRASLPVFATSIVFMPLGSLLPLMVLEHFSGGAWHNGIVKALFAAGMMLAALAIGVTGGMRRAFLMMSTAPFALGICSLAAGLLPLSAFWVFCILVFIMGMAGMWGNVPYIAYLQKNLPQENMGKVMSLVTSAMSLGIPIGMLIAGPVAEAIGVDGWMIWAGVGMMVVGAGSYLWTREFERSGR